MKRVSKIVRASSIDLKQNPFKYGDEASLRYIPDAGIAIGEDGSIVALSDFAAVQASYPTVRVINHSGRYAVPGFVKLHDHCWQIRRIAAWGATLIDWLVQFIFPEEELVCQDQDYARELARLFTDELVRHGCTTAMIFGTHSLKATLVFFEEAMRMGRQSPRIISGMSVGDRLLPPSMLHTPETAYRETCAVFEAVHGSNNGRASAAVTSRFAPACTPEMLAALGRALGEHRDEGGYFTTHLSETPEEEALVAALHPGRSYLEAYAAHGLLGPRSVFAHCVHTTDLEAKQLAESDSVVALCAGSNAFLGAGIPNLWRFVDAGVRVGLGTDVGAGTGLSPWREMEALYKASQLRMRCYGDCKQPPTPTQLFYLSNLAGAEALQLDGLVGNFDSGKEADFVVLDPGMHRFLPDRLQTCKTPADILFVFAMCGCPMREVYIGGELVHQHQFAE